MILSVSEISQIAGNDQHRMDNQIPEGMIQAAEKVIDQIKQAAGKGASLICFPQWFVGFGNVDNIPNDTIIKISDAAKENKIDVVTGTFRIPGIGMKSKPVSVMISRNGEVLGLQGKKNLYPLEEQWQLSTDEIEAFNTESGRIIISHGDDAVDPEVYNRVKEMKPDIWVLQTNEAINIKKYYPDAASFLHIIKLRARELSCVVCVPMLKGEFMHVDYRGGSFVVKGSGDVYSYGSGEGDLFILKV
jgi:predicted amidohydrolase